MAQALLPLFIDVPNRAFVASFTSAGAFNPPPFYFGDTPLVAVYGVQRTGVIGAPFSYVTIDGALAVTVAVLPAPNPNFGTFTVTFGGVASAAIQYNASAAALQASLNAVSTIATAGGVTVVSAAAAGGPWKIFWNVPGVIGDFTYNCDNLYPPSYAVEQLLVTGAAGVQQKLALALSQSPAGTNAAAFVPTSDTNGPNGAPAGQQATLSLLTAGAYDLLIGVQQVMAVLEVAQTVNGNRTVLAQQQVFLKADANNAALIAAINLAGGYPAAASVVAAVAEAAAAIPSLIPTTVKTVAYTAAPRDIVQINASASNVPVTLPTAPTDKSQVAVKLVAVSGSYACTVTCGGADEIDVAGGASSITLSLAHEGIILQYVAALAVWLIVEHGYALASLDGRYPRIGTVQPVAAITAPAYAASITPALGTSGANAIIDVGTLTGNLAVAAPTGTPYDGQTLTFRFVQDAAGGRVITWNAAYVFPLASPATSLPTGAGNRFEITFGYCAADATWRARGVAGPY